MAASYKFSVFILPAPATGTHKKLPNSLAAAVKQHPQAALSSIEAGFRYLRSSGLFDAGSISGEIAQLPLLKWLLNCIPSLCYPGGVGPADQFDSASLGELVRHVCSLLRTLFKLVLAAEPLGKLAEQLLGAKHAARSNRLLWMAATSAAGAAPAAATSSSNGSSSSGGGSSSSTWQHPFLQLTGLGFIVSAQGMRNHLQATGSSGGSSSRASDSSGVADQQQQQHATRMAGSISGKDLAYAVFDCLQYVFWAGTQLQQLVLPGTPSKAAAALDALKAHQCNLQCSLQQAMQQLLGAAAAAGAGANRQLQVQMKPEAQEEREDAVRCRNMPRVLHVERDPAEIWAGRGNFKQEVLVSRVLLKLYPGKLEQWQMPHTAAAKIVDCGLLQQLQAFGEALWSQLPQLHCCNNAACTNVAGLSESKLKASRCSKCKAALRNYLQVRG
jgi:hypothetical protein